MCLIIDIILIETVFLLKFEKDNNNQCVLSTAAIEGIDEYIQPKYYLVTIN